MNKMLTLLTIAQHLLGQKDRIEKNVIHWSWYVVVSIVMICSCLLAYLIALDHVGQKMAVVIAGFSTCLLYCIGYGVVRYIQYLKFKKMKQFATTAVGDVYQIATQTMSNLVNTVDRKIIIRTLMGGLAAIVFSKLLRRIF